MKRINLLIGSTDSGPVAQPIHQKERKVVLTFSDVAAREKGKGIKESSEKCPKISTFVQSSTGYFDEVELATAFLLEKKEDYILDVVTRDYNMYFTN